MTANVDLPRLLLAAPASGGGKTTATLGLLRTLLQRDMKPAAFKCGPDYIDPMFHREVLGVSGRNLDLFFMEEATTRYLLAQGASGADIAIVEGVMGFYDGVGGGDQASSWHVASATETPVVFVLRPKGAFLSLAALVNGFTRFRDKSMIRGILLNQCGARLYELLAPVLERETGIKAYGHIPDVPEAVIGSRHLGLVTPDGIGELKEKIRKIAERMEQSVDVDGLVQLAKNAPPLAAAMPAPTFLDGTPATIAVARDEAFCFYYEENFELLRRFGARLEFFSPLRDKSLPEGIGGLYLGGGYPELHAKALSENTPMLTAVKNAVESGLPTLAECGGFLYLQKELAGSDGVLYPMAGALNGTSRNTGRLTRFGYVEMRGERDSLIARSGETIRAHEFHYWDTDANGDAFAVRKPSGGGEWRAGVANERLYAGFPHLYFWNNPAIAGRFVEAARERTAK